MVDLSIYDIPLLHFWVYIFSDLALVFFWLRFIKYIDINQFFFLILSVDKSDSAWFDIEDLRVAMSRVGFSRRKGATPALYATLGLSSSRYALFMMNTSIEFLVRTCRYLTTLIQSCA